MGNSTVKKGAAEREVQQALLDLTVEHGLTKVMKGRSESIINSPHSSDELWIRTKTGIEESMTKNVPIEISKNIKMSSFKSSENIQKRGWARQKKA